VGRPAHTSVSRCGGFDTDISIRYFTVPVDSVETSEETLKNSLKVSFQAFASSECPIRCYKVYAIRFVFLNNLKFSR
jgi:hypothetical protein